MPSVVRRRRAVQEEEEDSESEIPQSAQRNGRRAPPSEDGESDEEADEDGADESMDVDDELDSQDQVVKKMVRYALACEYQRIPIKRSGISDKVIGKQRGAFKYAFGAAQKQLRTKFGMEMVELPLREKVTMKEKRAAQKTKGISKPTASYILTTVLPTEYRIPEIMPPSIIGSEKEEAAYIGLCTVIVAIIALSPSGSVPDHKLNLHLSRLNLEKNTGLGTKDALLKKMVTQGYIYKVTDKSADEETIDWRVGPRGKMEIGNKGIQGLVSEVYGENAPDDLDKRLQRSLGMEVARVREEGDDEAEAEEEASVNEEPGPSTSRTASGRRR